MPPVDLPAVLEFERNLMNHYAPRYRTDLLFNSYFYRKERLWFATLLLKTLRDAGRDLADCKILEVGCGPADNLELLAKAGCRNLTGLDLAEGMVEESRRAMPQARFVQGTIEHHDFRGEKFDAVLAAFTLHHMFDPASFFHMVERVLAPGGWFFIGEYNAKAWSNVPWSKLLIDGGMAPLRRLIKLKNRHALAQGDRLTAMFNPAHRILGFEEILRAMPHPEHYTIQRATRGLLLPAFNYALIEDSALDRFAFRALERFDAVVTPRDAGHIQFIIGQKRDRS